MFTSTYLPRPLTASEHHLWEASETISYHCREGIAARIPHGRALWRLLGDLGFIEACAQPGHERWNPIPALLLIERCAEVGDCGLALALCVQSLIACAWLSGSEAELRYRLMPAMLSGDLIACQCDTDPSADRPLTAQLHGDVYALNGRKLYVINGDVADLCFVKALTPAGPTVFLVEASQCDVRTELVYEKLGTELVNSVALRFDNVNIPISHCLCPPGPKFLWLSNELMGHMRLAIAAAAATMHGVLLSASLQHGLARQLGGKALLDWPINFHAWARAKGEHELMRAGLSRAIAMLAAGRSTIAETAAIKWFCVETANRFASLCCDLEGGAGYMRSSLALRMLSQLRGLRMSGGSQTTMMTISNHLLGCRAELSTFNTPVELAKGIQQ